MVTAFFYHFKSPPCMCASHYNKRDLQMIMIITFIFPKLELSTNKNKKKQKTMKIIIYLMFFQYCFTLAQNLHDWNQKSQSFPTSCDSFNSDIFVIDKMRNTGRLFVWGKIQIMTKKQPKNILLLKINLLKSKKKKCICVIQQTCIKEKCIID